MKGNKIFPSKDAPEDSGSDSELPAAKRTKVTEIDDEGDEESSEVILGGQKLKRWRKWGCVCVAPSFS